MDEVAHFTMSDGSALEVRISAPGVDATIRILVAGTPWAHVSQGGTEARKTVCGSSDFYRMVVDLPGDYVRPDFSVPTDLSRRERKVAEAKREADMYAWLADYGLGTHRASITRVDADTVLVEVDPDFDGVQDRVWTVDLGWQMPDTEFRRDCEAKLRASSG